MSQLRCAIHRLGRFAISAFVAVLLPLSAYAAEADKATDPTLATGRELSDLFLLGNTGVLWQRMTAPMQAAIKSQEAFAAFRKQVEAQLGTEHEVLSEKIDTVQGKQVYIRRALWSKAPTAVTMQWALEGTGDIAGFHIRPAAVAEPAPSAYLDYRTRANMRLPFDGEWLVVWGGRTLEQNYHAVSRGQRFAHDLVKVMDDKTHHGNGRELDHYYCWNEKILTP
ncbi:MAG TPA: M23 family peptidase, partial [Lysobacter sp.]|nr:M23 family peptidase [Lysobacter sp.]